MNTESSAVTAAGKVTENGTGALELEPLTPMKNVVKTGEAEFITALPQPRVILARRDEPEKVSDVIHTAPIKSMWVTVIALGPGCLTDVKVGDRITYTESTALPKELTSNVSWATKYVWLHENKILARLPRGSEDTGVALVAKAPIDASQDEAMEAWMVCRKLWVDLGQKLKFDPNDPNFVLGGPPKA